MAARSVPKISVTGTKHFTGRPCKYGHVAWRWTSSGECEVCHLARVKRSRLNNPGGRVEENKRYRAKYLEMLLVKERERREVDRENIRNAQRKYRERNRSLCNSRSAKWEKRHPDKRRIYGCLRRARKLNAGGCYTPDDLARIARSQKHRCAYCKVSLNESGRHLDHITPLVAGGTNWPNNLQWLCPTCNLRKNASDPIVYARTLGMLL